MQDEGCLKASLRGLTGAERVACSCKRCKPWGDDYVPDDRPWTFPPNALLSTEEAIIAAIRAQPSSGPRAEVFSLREVEQGIRTAMRALAKPDEGVVLKAVKDSIAGQSIYTGTVDPHKITKAVIAAIAHG